MNAPSFPPRHDMVERELSRADAKTLALGLSEPESLRLSIVDLGFNQCRWPTHDKPFFFCGHPQHETSSYCEYHMHRSRSE